MDENTIAIETKIQQENLKYDITKLAKQLFINSLTIPNPEGPLNGTYPDSDFTPDKTGHWYKRQDGAWINARGSFERERITRNWPRDPGTMDTGPVWHVDSYGFDRRLIRECYHQAELFYSTVEALQK